MTGICTSKDPGESESPARYSEKTTSVSALVYVTGSIEAIGLVGITGGGGGAGTEIAIGAEPKGRTGLHPQ